MSGLGQNVGHDMQTLQITPSGKVVGIITETFLFGASCVAALYAVLELLEEHKASTKNWYIASIVMCGLAALMFLYRVKELSDLSGHRTEKFDRHPLFLHACSNLLYDAVVMTMLTVFHVEGPLMSTFNMDRNNDLFGLIGTGNGLIPLPMRMLVTWYGILFLVVLGPILKLRGYAAVMMAYHNLVNDGFRQVCQCADHS